VPGGATQSPDKSTTLSIGPSGRNRRNALLHRRLIDLHETCGKTARAMQHTVRVEERKERFVRVSRIEPLNLRGWVMPGLDLKTVAEFARLISQDSKNWRFVVIDLKLDFLVTVVAAVSVVSLVCWITGLSCGGRRSSAIS
jgi:hypothetical protein